MKNLLLGTAAIAGLVLASAPAAAQMELTIGGHSKNYIGWQDQDEAPGASVKSFDMQRETELHFNGESTLNNGLTFGFQIEAEVDAGDDSNTIEESYIYLASSLGRLNLGSEDGAAYLLQVSAPSADSNIDGIRQYINPVNAEAAFGLAPGTLAAATTPGGTFGRPAGATNLDGLDYDQDLTGIAEKVTYLSPNIGGLQVGGSYTTSLGDDNSAQNIANGFNADTAGVGTDEAWEVAGRYEGVISNFGYAVGAGYTDADQIEQWNVGVDVDAGPVGLGVVYTETDADAAGDVETFVVGVDYTTGPVKFGASFFTQDDDTTTVALGDTLESNRYTGGVVYTAGPGLSFRGSVSFLDQEAGPIDADSTSVLGGVQINF